MTKDWRVFAEHILEGIERIWEYRARVEAGRADADMASDAILRLLETIAEAASDKLPDTIKERHADIDWKRMSGMRVRLAHVYLAIDPAVIEATVARDLGPLYEAMKIEIPDWDTRKDKAK